MNPRTEALRTLVREDIRVGRSVIYATPATPFAHADMLAVVAAVPRDELTRVNFGRRTIVHQSGGVARFVSTYRRGASDAARGLSCDTLVLDGVDREEDIEALTPCVMGSDTGRIVCSGVPAELVGQCPSTVTGGHRLDVA